MEPKTVAPALVAALRDADPSVRASAANALKYFPAAARQVIPALIELIRDRDVAVHNAAACTLEVVGSLPNELIPSVVAALKDHYLKRHESGAENLSISQPAAEEADLIPPVLSGESSASEQGLRRILSVVPNVETLLPALNEVAKDPNEAVRVLANSALERIGPAAIPALIDVTHCQAELARLPAFHTLTNIAFKEIHLHGRTIMPALIARLDDSNERLRRAAAEALGQIGPEAKAALPSLTELANQGSTELRNAVAETIRRINSGESLR